jgi:hypothetical protein
LKISKELDESLEAISKEVDSWPDWKRSIDLRELTKLTEASQPSEAAGDKRKPPLSARAAGG